MKSAYLLTLLSVAILSTTAAPIRQKTLSTCYSHAKMTEYWIPKEGDQDMLNNGKIVTLTGAKVDKIQTKKGVLIADVADTTYQKFQMEGTGLLQTGQLVNLDDGKTSFELVDRKAAPFGYGGFNENSLVPWVSVAANDISAGTTLYVKELDGVKLPNGMTHNGCVRVDDQGWSFGNCQIDFFVLQYTAYTSLSHVLPGRVTIQEQSCQVLNYVDSSIMQWAVLN
ncbi:hypothetical protein BDF14DRAFT_1742002 [Spinellus fusiger]|nr:hypothetical protein BDF14DRAFT_1742002 [Spinellus fusiger]